MQLVCHSWDAYLSFSLFLTFFFFSWSLAAFLAGCTSVSISLFLCTFPCLPLPPTLHLFLSAAKALEHKVFSYKWILKNAAHATVSHAYYSLLMKPPSVCRCALTASITPWLSHCLRTQSHVFTWSLWEFAASEAFTPRVSSDLYWDDGDDDLLHFKRVLNYFAHSLCYQTHLPCTRNDRGRLNPDSWDGKRTFNVI